MEEGNTLVNALVGAAVSAVTSGFGPFGPLVGGGVSGYLQGGTRSDGLRVGALAGALASVPVVFVAFFALSFLGFVSVGGDTVVPFAFGGIFLLFSIVIVATTVAVSAAGGWLGNYVKYDTDFEI